MIFLNGFIWFFWFLLAAGFSSMLQLLSRRTTLEILAKVILIIIFSAVSVVNILIVSLGGSFGLVYIFSGNAGFLRDTVPIVFACLVYSILLGFLWKSFIEFRGHPAFLWATTTGCMIDRMDE